MPIIYIILISNFAYEYHQTQNTLTELLYVYILYMLVTSLPQNASSLTKEDKDSSFQDRQIT